MLNNIEVDIIERAIIQLQQLIEIPIQWIDHGPLDGRLVLELPKRNVNLIVEVKREIRNYNMPQIEKYQKENEQFILVANIIYKKQRDALRKKGISYLDTQGNVFIKTDGIFILVESPKQKPVKQVVRNRAYTKTGLKVVLQFLLDKDLINAPQRIIAEKANVALGNIPHVITGLKDTGYLVPLNDKEYLWENRVELLERWINDYETTLIPKIRKGTFRMNGDWREIKLEKETVWGGEAAGELMTNYLRAENLIMYTREHMNDLMTKYRIIPDEKGNIEVREKFWNDNYPGKVTPHIITYGDLILANNERCRDSAKMIFDEYIQRHL